MENNKFDEAKRTSSLSGKLHKYLLVDELPSNFRSYDVKEVYVRGLFFEESENLAKYVGDTKTEDVSYKILKNIYSDVIQGIDVGDLELPDFQILMIISSIWTIRGYGWVPNIPCPQIVENKLIPKLKNEIDELISKNAEEAIPDFEDKLKQLQDDLGIQPSKVQCQGIINRKIELDDLETYDTRTGSLPMTIKMGEDDYTLGALTVDDLIVLEDYAGNPDYKKTYLSYAMMIKNPEMSVDDKYNAIRYNEQKDVKQIKDLDNELFIKIKPVNKQCPLCLKNCKVYIGLDKLKAYP